MTKHTLHRLKDNQIKRAKGPSTLQGGGGLRVKVTRDNHKSFVLRYTWDRKSMEVGLGGYPKVSLAAARNKAAEARSWLNGTPKRDPKAEWKAQADEVRSKARAVHAASVTFGEHAETMINENESSWKTADTADQWRRSLKKHCNHIWNMPIHSVDVEAVKVCLLPIWKSTHVTAKRVRNRIERILDSASVLGLRTGENPARWRGNLEFILPRVRHTPIPHPSVHYSKIPDLWNMLEAEGTVAAKIIQFDILTASRSGEARAARWKEIDLQEGTWTLPNGRMKNNEPHQVPLSPAAIDLLNSLPEGKGEDLVFPSPATLGVMSDRALNKVLNRLGAKDKFGNNATVHGMRNSFRDCFGEETDYSTELLEFALAHTPDKTERGYRRERAVKRRREIMGIWGRYCTGDLDLNNLSRAA